jgi:amino acid transporter
MVTRVAKRLVIGRPVSSDDVGRTMLPKRIALPIFASDPLSSVAYATQEILLVLTLAGTAYLYLAPWLAALVVLLFLTVVASYKRLVEAYPSGGGDYEVVSRNLGRPAGVVVAGALLVDYVLTVAVSTSAGVDNMISAVPSLNEHRLQLALGFIAVLAAANLRGMREAGKAFAAPTYLFCAGILILIATGLFRTLMGDAPVAESAQYEVIPEPDHATMTTIALVFFVLRAFSAGCTALTGVWAISSGMQAFRPPKVRNAQVTLLTMAALATTMFIGITIMAIVAEVRFVANPCDLVGFEDCETQPQRTAIAQIAGATFGPNGFGFYFIVAVTALILILAANTSFNGFPLTASILAQDRILPRQMHTRGDRLVYSNAILMLALFAGLLVWIYDADPTRLIQLYILGVFTAFTLGQAGMVRHWNSALRIERDPRARRRMMRSRGINAAGSLMTGVVLIVVTVTKFTHGAYLVMIAIPLLYLLMSGIYRHYSRVARELAIQATGFTLPSRNHVVVLVSKVHKPTLRALAFARATRPDTLTAVTVNVDDDETRELLAEWDSRDLPVPLTVLHSPYREVTGPVLEYVRNLRRDNPRELVSVFIPEYVVGRWWENLLHNQSALRLKGRLLFESGVMVTSVPWQLDSSRSAPSRPPLVSSTARLSRGGSRSASGDDRAGTSATSASPAPPVPSAEEPGR